MGKYESKFSIGDKVYTACEDPELRVIESVTFKGTTTRYDLHTQNVYSQLNLHSFSWGQGGAYGDEDLFTKKPEARAAWVVRKAASDLEELKEELQELEDEQRAEEIAAERIIKLREEIKEIEGEA